MNEHIVLTNGTKNPNATRGASGENYYEMRNRIKSLGSLKEILKNNDLVKSIIAYNGDRHFFAAFIDLINEGLANHEITSNDLGVFTSGEVADAIVNMKTTAHQYGNRKVYPAEIWDKLNYLATINDSYAYTASFTHPEILKAMEGNENRELTEWSKSSHIPPVGGFAAIVSELLESGNIETAKNYIQSIGNYFLQYATNQKQNGFSLLHNNSNGQLLTNGTKNPNATRGASGENYYEMRNRIKSLGSLKEILKNNDLVKSIIAYNGDRHFFAAFIDLINEGLANHEITSNDLGVFTSGEVADAIVNMKTTAHQYGNRKVYPAEIWDKLNYLATINDSYAYAASFTHPEILKAMEGNGNRELTEWSKSSHMPPVGGFAAVIYKMIERGDIEDAKEFIDRIAYYSKKYSQAHKTQLAKNQTKQQDNDLDNYYRTYQESLQKNSSFNSNKPNHSHIKESSTKSDIKSKTENTISQTNQTIVQNHQMAQSIVNAFNEVANQKIENAQNNIKEKDSSEISLDLEDFAKQEQTILNAKQFTEEQKAKMIQELYQEFDNYVEENPEHHKTR